MSLHCYKLSVCSRSVRVIPRTSTRCNHWQLVEFPEQMCCYDIEPHPIRLNEGALLVDQGYLTAIKQFDTYLKSHLSTSVALFVRIGYFMTWIQNIVLDPVPSKVYIPVCVRFALNLPLFDYYNITIIRLRAFLTFAL